MPAQAAAEGSAATAGRSEPGSQSCLFAGRISVVWQGRAFSTISRLLSHSSWVSRCSGLCSEIRCLPAPTGLLCRPGPDNTRGAQRWDSTLGKASPGGPSLNTSDNLNRSLGYERKREEKKKKKKRERKNIENKRELFAIATFSFPGLDGHLTRTREGSEGRDLWLKAALRRAQCLAAAPTPSSRSAPLCHPVEQ